MARRGDGIYQRGGKGGAWWLDFRHQGHRHIVRLGSNISRSVALEIAGVKRTGILRGEAGIGVEKRKDAIFEAAREEFLRWSTTNKKPRTARCYRQYLDQLLTSFAGKRLSQICRLDIERHRRRRVAAGASVRANREISLLKNLFNRCLEWNLFEGVNPVVGVKLTKEPQQRLRYLEAEEESRLLAHCPEPLQSLLTIAINTGIRIESEGFTLQWNDVDMRRRLLTVTAAFAKSGKTRTIPLNTRAIEALTRLRGRTTGDYVFVRRDGEPYRSFPDRQFARGLKRSGLTGTGITPHTCRHTFCSRLVAAGVDLITVQELGGWSDLSLVMRYAHLAPGQKTQAVEKIAAAFHDAMPKEAIEKLAPNSVTRLKINQSPRSSVG